MPEQLRLLLCATDAGGGRNVCAVATHLAVVRPDITVYLIEGPITAHMFEGIPANRITVSVDTEEDAVSLLAALRPDALIVGRTRYISPERRLTCAARDLAIPSVQIVDDWMNYLFNVSDQIGDLKFLTNLVCCPNEMAVAEAAAEGVPPAHLVATGCPALSDLCDRLLAHAGTPPPPPQAITDHPNHMVVLFLSEPCVADNGDGVTPGAHGPYMGYTERTVRADLAEAAALLGDAVLVVEKLHPSETKVPAPPALAPSVAWHTTSRSALVDWILHADMVVGMRSIALLESVMAGKPSVSYQPGLRIADTCTAARLGLVDALRSPTELKRWLLDHKSVGAAVQSRPAFADPRASERILAQTLALVGTGKDTTARKHRSS